MNRRSSVAVLVDHCADTIDMTADEMTAEPGGRQ